MTISYTYRGPTGMPVQVTTSVAGAKGRFRHIESGDYAALTFDPKDRERFLVAAEAEAVAILAALLQT